MKKRCLLLTLAAIFSLGLAGCKSNSKTSDTEIVSSSEPVEPSEPSEPSESSEPEEPIENLFPVKDILSFYETAGLDVVVPAYVSEANDFETDTSDEKAFVVYANNSTTEEMTAYKDALVEETWSVLSEVDGDYTLAFAETTARVSLVNFDDYVGIAFSVYEETPVVEGMTPEEAVNSIAYYWSGKVVEVKTGIFGTQAAFPAASYSVDDMKGFVSSMFVPEEFELVNDWTVAEDGTNSCAYVNAVMTVLEIYVYADTVYVKDGKIVEEGTEGAVATDVTCIEVYGYTYSE